MNLELLTPTLHNNLRIHAFHLKFPSSNLYNKEEAIERPVSGRSLQIGLARWERCAASDMRSTVNMVSSVRASYIFV